jgi:hypothetical protein
MDINRDVTLSLSGTTMTAFLGDSQSDQHLKETPYDW